MKTLEQEIDAWLTTASPDDVRQRLIAAERESFAYHVFTTLGQIKTDDLAVIEKAAADLYANGYRRPQ